LKQRWLQIFADLDVNAHHQDDCKNSTSITSKHAPTLPPPSNRQSISNDNTQSTIRGSTAAQSSSNGPQTMLFTAQSLAYLTGKLTTQQQRWQQLD